MTNEDFEKRLQEWGKRYLISVQTNLTEQEVDEDVTYLFSILEEFIPKYRKP